MSRLGSFLKPGWNLRVLVVSECLVETYTPTAAQDGELELLVGSEDFEIRVFRGEEVSRAPLLHFPLVA